MKNSHGINKQKVKGSKIQRGGIGDPCDECRKEPPADTVNKFIKTISTMLKANIKKVPPGASSLAELMEVWRSNSPNHSHQGS